MTRGVQMGEEPKRLISPPGKQGHIKVGEELERVISPLGKRYT